MLACLDATSHNWEMSRVLTTSLATDRLERQKETHSIRSNILSCALKRLFYCKLSRANALGFPWYGQKAPGTGPIFLYRCALRLRG